MAPSAETLTIGNPEHRLIHETARRYFDTATAAAEALDGSMHIFFFKQKTAYEIYSRKDSTRFGEMMSNSLNAASDMLIDNRNLAFERRRRKLEAEELPLMIDM